MMTKSEKKTLRKMAMRATTERWAEIDVYTANDGKIAEICADAVKSILAEIDSFNDLARKFGVG